MLAAEDTLRDIAPPDPAPPDSPTDPRDGAPPPDSFTDPRELEAAVLARHALATREAWLDKEEALRHAIKRLGLKVTEVLFIIKRRQQASLLAALESVGVRNFEAWLHVAAWETLTAADVPAAATGTKRPNVPPVPGGKTSPTAIAKRQRGASGAPVSPPT